MKHLGETKNVQHISDSIKFLFRLDNNYYVDKIEERKKSDPGTVSNCVVTICTLDIRSFSLLCVIFYPMWCNFSTLHNGGDQERPVDSSGSCFHCSCYSIAFPPHQAGQWTGLS